MSQFSRKLNNQLFTLCCYLALAAVAVVLTSLLWTLLSKGATAFFDLSFFSKVTPPPGVKGGLLNAIYGSLLMTGIAVLLAVPMGVSIALYLAEFSKNNRLSHIVRFANDVLLSTPSILIGLFCYALFVQPLHHFSAVAGSIALAIIALPIIVRTSEDMFATVPTSLREAACALGAPYWKVIHKVIIRAALHGMLTGILLAIARILGETAPLLFTSLNNQFWSSSLNKPMASLPVVIYQYAMSPYADWQALAWGGALLITLIVCSLTLVSQFMTKSRR